MYRADETCDVVHIGGSELVGKAESGSDEIEWGFKKTGEVAVYTHDVAERGGAY